MRKSGWSSLWAFCSIVAVGSTVLTLYTNERTVAAGGCYANTDCGCSVDDGCPAPGNASEPGYCNESTTECICNTGFSGEFCCANNCSGNGICDLGGSCFCSKGFTGDDCSMGIIGACCLGTECAETNGSACKVGGGLYQGDGTNCSSNPCPTDCGSAFAPECNGDCPTGFNCSMALEMNNSSEAPAGGGARYQDCECLAGACCFPVRMDGPDAPAPECSRILSQLGCERSGGTYLGDGTNCSACDSLCGFSEAPACGGECPPGEACEFHEANGVPAGCECEPVRGGCCVPGTGSCYEADQASCEGRGNTYQGDDTNCSAVECPRDCGFSFAPECGGACPEGQQCLQNLDVAVEGAGGGAGFIENSQCQCFTPPGGECDPQQDTCQPDFVCDPGSEVCCNRICDGPGETCDNTGICHVPAPAPAMSDTGLLVIIALLLATGGIGLLRRRVHRQ